jgi:DNA-binding MarR family transcriptional regulator/GNAT superfamily N-acetyltransferase
MALTDSVPAVRAFNRTVVERIGVLSDSYLTQDRPLGEARLLWEIGPDGCDVRVLRSRLGLDSGYLSRLLRSLQRAGLVTVTPTTTDQRVRTAELTEAGRAEHALLDSRSDDLAISLLRPLSDTQQQRLVAAMSTVTQLLTAAAVQLEVVDPEHPHARYCLGEYFGELDRRFEVGFDATQALATDPVSMRPPRGLFVLATLRGTPVGCGALKLLDGTLAEVKRVWVAPDVRGLGLGARLMRDLEGKAAAAGRTTVRLDTGASLTEAIALYRRLGYHEVAPFNAEPYADFWFEKGLASPDGVTS